MPLPPGDSTQGMSSSTPPRSSGASRSGNRYTRLTQSNVPGFNMEQLTNAAIIVSVGRAMGMTTRDIQIGLITAITESGLINVNHGDRDSLGLFQQRPSQGWGTPEQVTNPEYAARKFFSTLKALGDRRFQIGMGEAAQAVQRSDFPDRYATHIREVRGMWPTVLKMAGGKPQTIEGDDYTATDAYLDSNPLVGNQISGADYEAGLPGEGPSPYSVALDASGAGGYGTGESLVEVETPQVTPTVHQMLGAWGMGNPTVQQPEAAEPLPAFGGRDPFIDSALPLISPSTNASLIQPMSEEMGDFTKGVDGWRKAVIAAAKTALGTPYTWGGNSLQGGVDCSGLVQQAFAAAGISIPRVSYQQANFGARVALDALRPGDLVAWDNSSRNNGADHIAIYIGGGQIIEAARPGTAVRIRSVGPDEGAWGVRINR